MEDSSKAIVSLSHVSYKSGALADMGMINKVIQGHNALSLWDLCHSIGVVPIQLDETKTDLAVGCTYKYLNGGPGSPAFLYVSQHLLNNPSFQSPIGGWWAQTGQFDFGDEFHPRVGIERFMAGTPPILALVPLDSSLDMITEAGIHNIRQKSKKLTSYMMDLCERHLTQYDFTIATPKNSDERGSHVSLAHDEAGRISVALRQAGVISDHRPPNIVRLGLSPLDTGYVDVLGAVRRLQHIMQTGTY